MAHAREKRTRKMTYVEMKDVSKYYQMGENVVTANDKITFGIKKGRICCYSWAFWGRKIHSIKHTWWNG